MRNRVLRLKKIPGSETLVKLWPPRGSQIGQAHNFWSLFLQSLVDWESLNEKFDLEKILF